MSASILSSLKFAAKRKVRAVPDVIRRRKKLIQKLTEQRELAIALTEGRIYAPKRLRTVLDVQSGQRLIREVPIRIKAWWWMGEKGETLLSVFYGSKMIELTKGKTAVDVGDPKNLPNVLDVLINATINCELDSQLEVASVKLRDGFKK